MRVMSIFRKSLICIATSMVMVSLNAPVAAEYSVPSVAGQTVRAYDQANVDRIQLKRYLTAVTLSHAAAVAHAEWHAEQDRIRTARAAAAAKAATTKAAAPAGSSGSSSVWNHLARIKACESGGNYGAVSGTGKYRGAYQFSRATWDSTARSAGRAHLIGVDPAAASPADQDAQAYTLYTTGGPGHWPECQYA